MLFQRPSFKEYVMARLVSLAVFIFVLFFIIVTIFIEDEKLLSLFWVLLALAFVVFTFAIYRSAITMQKELRRINQYLKGLDDVNKLDDFDYKPLFFTKEFEDIHHHLIKILRSSKKREDMKQRYNTKLKIKNQQRADMISAIAHEFRNPITSIMGYAQTLEEDKDISPALQDKFLSKIHNNGMKIELLLSRLVLWNQFESKEMTLHPSEFDFYQLAQEIIQELEEKYPQREMIVEGELYRVNADRTLMGIVLKNLIENGLKYSTDEVVIFIKKGEVSVRDRGVGILPREISKVTKKFYRSGAHSWDNSMGLGLSLVKNILKLHHTTLEIESEVNVGSEFFFHI